MSSGLQSKTFREHASGKWQIPLLLLSVPAFVTALILTRPVPPIPTLDERIAHIQSMRNGVMLHDAAQLAYKVLKDEVYADQNKAGVYGLLGDILYRIESDRDIHDTEDVMRIITTYAQAELMGASLPGDAYAQCGQAYEWMGQPQGALEQYTEALKLHPSDALSIEKKALAIRLAEDDQPREELHTRLDQMRTAASSRPEILKWALEQKVQLLMNENRIAECAEIVSNHTSDLEGTAFEPFVEYLRGWIQYRSGQFDQAEITLRNLRNQLKVRDDIHAKSGWLLGRILLRDDGPQRPLQAISFFEDVLKSHVVGEYVTASKLGMAEALTDLQRFDEALDYYRDIIRDLKLHPQTQLVNQNTLIRSLNTQNQMLRDDGHDEYALAYLQLASDLVDARDIQTRMVYLNELARLKAQIADDLKTRAANQLSEGDEETAQAPGARSRELYLSAAQDYSELAELSVKDEEEAAESLWKSALMYDLSGDRQSTIALLEAFLAERPNSMKIPQVLHQLGQAQQAGGQLEKAIDYYKQCIESYGRTDPAQRSVIPLANCYFMLGPDYSKQTEEALLYVLEESPTEPSMFTPRSLIYRTALFKLGELYSRDERYEEAIGRLDEAVQRYPDDERLPRALFLLADAYRHSGLALGIEAASVGNTLRREEMLHKKETRLQLAEELFGRVVELLSAEKLAGALTRIQALQLKLSYVYRADCAFDQAEYERALNLYGQVTRAYLEDPIVLSAYFQMIHCQELLGRRGEVLPALRRAQWLTEKIDERKLQERIVMSTREEWNNLFAWIGQTGDYE